MKFDFTQLPPPPPTSFDPARLPLMRRFFAPDVPQAERDLAAKGVVDDTNTVVGPICNTPREIR